MEATGSVSPGRAGGGRRVGVALGAAWLALAAATGACRPIRYGGGGAGGGATVDGGGATVNGDCQPLAPIARRIWRLSIPQYANSVRDLLGLPAAPMIAAGANANGGQTFLVDDSLSLDPDLALQIDGTAHRILTEGTVDPSGLAACESGETEDACARRFAQTFGRRAFRRPLASDEVADLLVVYADGRQQDFASGIALLAEALLISPSFLFRTELGAAATGTTTLTPYEVASQLSYTFVDSTPDAPLLDAAGSGALVTEGGIAAQVDRLLATDAARQNVDRIVANWFHAGNLALQKKDWGLLSSIGGPDADQNGAVAETGQGARGAAAPPGGSRLTGVDDYDPSDPSNHPHQVLGRLQLSLIRAAFLCDLTRVATFQWASGTSGVVFPGDFNGASLGVASSPHYAPSQSTAPATVAWLAQIEIFYAQQTAQFLQELAATIDVDGNSLLDNTVVVYVSEIGRAYDHDMRNVPFLVFGGKNTGIHGGRFLKVTGGPLATVDGAATGNRPTNDAWLALAPIFGVNLPSLGAASQFTGPLPGVVG